MDSAWTLCKIERIWEGGRTSYIELKSFTLRRHKFKFSIDHSHLPVRETANRYSISTFISLYYSPGTYLGPRYDVKERTAERMVATVVST